MGKWLVIIGGFMCWAGTASAEGVPSTFDDLVDGAAPRSRLAQGLYFECRPSDNRGGPAALAGRSLACKDTIGAILDTLEINATLTPVRVYCPKDPLHWIEAADVFVKWAEANPDHLRVPGAVAVVEALRGAHPCREGKI